MLITEFLKKLRKRNNETLQDMARKIGCSAQFLFYVESGRSIPPSNWQEILEKEYSLSQKKKRDLKKAIFFSRNRDKIKIDDLKDEDKQLLLEIAFNFKKYKKKIKEILN